MLILAGVHRRDCGDIILEGAPLEIEDPHHAQTLGISMVHQELSLAAGLSVAENTVINRQPGRRLG